MENVYFHTGWTKIGGLVEQIVTLDSDEEYPPAAEQLYAQMLGWA